MSLNIGTPGVEAVKALANDPHFAKVREAIREMCRVYADRALEATEAGVHDAVGYARGLRDVFLALESAATGTVMARVKRPGGKTE